MVATATSMACSSGWLAAQRLNQGPKRQLMSYQTTRIAILQCTCAWRKKEQGRFKSTCWQGLIRALQICNGHKPHLTTSP